MVHRDLKPPNVLVTPDGEPRLLDFGIAKLMDPVGDSTRTADCALTLDYASPEQVRGDAISTACDIYSLGVLLYELIAGKRPYSFSGRPLEEAVDCICQREPAPPSSVASQPLAEDLDAIVLKALRKEPQERYASVRALNDDIERYLRSLPVLARRGTVRYVATKFMRRHRGAVAVAAIVLAMLCGATVSVAWEARIARQERDRAQQRFNAVRGLARSVIFDLEKKIAAIPGTTQVRKDLLSDAVKYLDSVAKDGGDDPGLQGELAAGFIRVGNIQGNPQDQNLGDLTAALASYAKAERIARALIARYPSGRSKRLLGDVLTAQASGAQFANQPEKGVAKAKEALQVARDRLRSDPASTDAQFQLGSALHCRAAFGIGKDKLPYLEEEASVFDQMLDRDPFNPDRMAKRRARPQVHRRTIDRTAEVLSERLHASQAGRKNWTRPWFVRRPAIRNTNWTSPSTWASGASSTTARATRRKRSSIHEEGARHPPRAGFGRSKDMRAQRQAGIQPEPIGRLADQHIGSPGAGELS